KASRRHFSEKRRKLAAPQPFRPTSPAAADSANRGKLQAQSQRGRRRHQCGEKSRLATTASAQQPIAASEHAHPATDQAQDARTEQQAESDSASHSRAFWEWS